MNINAHVWFPITAFETFSVVFFFVALWMDRLSCLLISQRQYSLFLCGGFGMHSMPIKKNEEEKKVNPICGGQKHRNAVSVFFLFAYFNSKIRSRSNHFEFKRWISKWMWWFQTESGLLIRESSKVVLFNAFSGPQCHSPLNCLFLGWNYSIGWDSFIILWLFCYQLSPWYL